MYICDVAKDNVFKCNEILYSYLKDKLPLLSRDDKYYYFTKNERLDKVLKEAPLHIKILARVVSK